MRIFFIGDLVGKPGRRIVKEKLKNLVDEYKIDLVIANGENAAGGFGLTEKIKDEILDCGVDIITSGNHIWDKKEIYDFIDSEPRLLRPQNYPPDVPGKGFYIYSTKNKEKIAIINLLGRTFMEALDCPFRAFQSIIKDIREETHNIIVDFHAEATSEKKSFLFFADGLVSAIMGTHTHVQTADAIISSKGTAYITDVGMTGVQHSVIGMRPKEILEKFIQGLPTRFQVASGDSYINAVIIELDQKGKVLFLQPGIF